LPSKRGTGLALAVRVRAREKMAESGSEGMASGAGIRTEEKAE
jgi:hypothetical protein